MLYMYTIEIDLDRRADYHSPDEAKDYYGKYAREGITVHYWNSPDKVKDSDHDNIVKYIKEKPTSVNYVVSNHKITMLVHPDNVAWASQNGNPTTISIEFSPHLNDQGYKRGGWLISELEERYNRTLKLYPHCYWIKTSCPGDISIDRLRKEADNFKNGEYMEKPINNGDLVNIANTLGIKDKVKGENWHDVFYKVVAPKVREMRKEKPLNEGDVVNIANALGTPKAKVDAKNWHDVFYQVVLPALANQPEAAKKLQKIKDLLG